MKRKRNSTPVVPVREKEFIRAWQQSRSVAEVATKVRMNKNACRVRAHRYRKMGIPLKRFPPIEYEPLDLDALAQYAWEMLPPAEREANDTAPAEVAPGTVEVPTLVEDSPTR
jgi:hypothetical protein